MTSQVLYVFWKYDICPYVLGAKIRKFWPDGRVEPEGYAHFAVTPLAILPEETGAKALERLLQLRHEVRAAEEAMKKKCAREAALLIAI